MWMIKINVLRPEVANLKDQLSWNKRQLLIDKQLNYTSLLKVDQSQNFNQQSQLQEQNQILLHENHSIKEEHNNLTEELGNLQNHYQATEKELHFLEDKIQSQAKKI
eukprot:403339130